MAKVWQPPANWQSRPVCVLGAGVLGRRIAACFIAAGHTVRIRDPSSKARTEAAEYIKTNLGLFTNLSNRNPGQFETLEDFEKAVDNCWLVFEAVPEILSVKEDTFVDLEKHAPKDCIFGSNSSSYKSGDLIGKISDETKTRVLNTHYMMPPEAIIVELMTSGHTAPEIFPFLVDRHKEAGLHPIVALKESTGFIFNRIWAAVKREVLSVLAEGVATPETIDAMWIEQYTGRKVGPCQLMDQVGLDTVEHIEEHYIKDRKLPSYHLDWLQKNYISSGKLGLKSNAGGLYPAPAPGTQTKILLLNIGLAEPLKTNKLSEMMHSGQILSHTVERPGDRAIELVGKLPCPDGIDVASSTKRMYWTNMGTPQKNDGSIQSANLDGSDIQYVVKPGEVHTPKQMVIDQESQKIYYCDREGLSVMRCNLDGSQQEVLFQTGDWRTDSVKGGDSLYWPVGITLSKKLNKFFWTQKGHSKANEGRIFAAGLHLPPEGFTAATRPDVETIISGLPECIDLECDDEEGILYWTDRGEIPFGNTLNKKHLVGPVPEQEKELGREIIAQGLGEGIGLRLDKARNCLYVADMAGHLWQCSVNKGLKEEVYKGPTHAYTGVTFYKF